MNNIERLRDGLRSSLKDLESFLQSPVGQNSLKCLKAKYGGDVVEADPYSTHIRIGERRVLDYLIELSEDN